MNNGDEKPDSIFNRGFKPDNRHILAFIGGLLPSIYTFLLILLSDAMRLELLWLEMLSFRQPKHAGIIGGWISTRSTNSLNLKKTNKKAELPILTSIVNTHLINQTCLMPAHSAFKPSLKQIWRLGSNKLCRPGFKPIDIFTINPVNLITFYFIIFLQAFRSAPLVMNTISAARPTAGRQTQPRFGAHYNILSIDDDSVIRNPISKRFQVLMPKRGDTVTMLTAVNAEDGIAQLEESAKDPADRFDLVVTDFQMPNTGDGYRVLEHIQGMGKNSKPRHVVMYSSTSGVKEKALELGAEEVYDKTKITPFNLVSTLIQKFFPNPERPTTTTRSKSTSDIHSLSPKSKPQDSDSPKPFEIPFTTEPANLNLEH